MTTENDPRLTAAVDLVGRTGAAEFRVDYRDDPSGDGLPTVWIAMARYRSGGYQLGADFDPLGAVFDLLDRLIDGAVCTHCDRPTGVDHESTRDPMLDGLADAVGAICWYRFDPELVTYRRTCEGEAA